MRVVVSAIFAVIVLVCGVQPLSAQIQGQWTGAGAMLSPRELDAQVRLSNGNVLAVGGVDNSGNLLASAEIYHPNSNKWTSTGSMAVAREAFQAVVLTSGKVLVSGGLGTGGTVLNAVELYDPKTGSWASAGSLAVARFDHSATLLTNGKVLVAGGCTEVGCATDTAVSEIYDPATNSWATTGSLNTARSYHAAVRLNNGAVLAIGGFAGGASASCEIYDVATGTWKVAASTNVARYQHGATVLPDGKVLVTGGVIVKYPLNSAELYDPASNTWTLTGAMTSGRYAHTSTLLPDGTVLLSGGEGQSISCGKACTGFIPTASAELFDEAKGTFTRTASLNRALAYHTATLLKTGRAFESGGIGYNAYCCQVVSDASFYTPSTMTFTPSSLNFGVLQIGLTSPPQTITVANVSSHAAIFTSIAGGGDFAETNNCPATLNAGQSCTVSVTFVPSLMGTRSGAVTLRDNDPGSPVQTIALTGTGETLSLGLTPASLNLGSVAVGVASSQTATLINDGAGPVSITGISIAPADNTFTQTNNCPPTLNVQQSCTVTIVFTPPDVFTYNATLSVKNSAGAAATLSLTGIGLDGGGG